MGAGKSCRSQCCADEERGTSLSGQCFTGAEGVVLPQGVLDGQVCCPGEKDGDAVDFHNKAISVPVLNQPMAIPFVSKDHLDDFADVSSCTASSTLSAAECSPGGGIYFIAESEELEELKNNPCKKNRKEARAPYTFRTGAVYTGEWLNNQRHGFGSQQWQDGSRFEGEWRENRAYGKGYFRYEDGSSYIGEWQHNLAHGLGAYFHSDQTTSYRGEWCRDVQHGHGVEVWEKDAQYTGEFVDGDKVGSGVYQWPDMSTYQGQWQAKKHGWYGDIL